MNYRRRVAAAAASAGAILALCLPATAGAGTTVRAPVKPAGMRLAPPVVCTMANRMDIFVDEDGILWECICDALKSGHICAWKAIAGVDADRIRRKIQAGLLPPRFYYKARWRTIRPLYTRPVPA